nr:facilitated trehalose transporter Tret1-like [Procambarus clarkii]
MLVSICGLEQVLSCLAASLGTLSAGAVNGWSAGALPSLDADPHIQMGTSNNAWVVGIVALGAIVGSTVAGRVTDVLGRRKTILASCPFLFAGWIIIALASNLGFVLTGRALCGLSTAFLFSAVQVYCSEIPEGGIRGRLGAVPSLFVTLGVVLTYVAGACFSWRTSCYICATPCVLTFVAIIFVPESPHWLLLRGKRDDAEVALRRLRGPNYDLTKEITEMEAKIVSVGRKHELGELWRPRTRRPFLIALFNMTLQQISGGNILIMYTGNIFISAGVANHNMAIVYTGLVQIAGTLLSVILMDHAGRRPMIVISTAVMGISIIMLGIYFYMINVVGDLWPGWVPLTTVLVAVFGYCLGCRTIPFLLSAELFNTTIRSTANNVTFFYNRILNFAVIQTFPYFEESAGAYTVFFVLGGLCLACCGISLICVPETKGKTLEQLQEYFEKKSTSTPECKVNDKKIQEPTISYNDVTSKTSKSLIAPSSCTLVNENVTNTSRGLSSTCTKTIVHSEKGKQDESSVESTKL